MSNQKHQRYLLVNIGNEVGDDAVTKFAKRARLPARRRQHRIQPFGIEAVHALAAD